MFTFNIGIIKSYVYIYINCFIDKNRFISIKIFIIITFSLKAGILILTNINEIFIESNLANKF